MLTAAQAEDIQNLCETRIITSLGADSWLKEGGTGGVKKIVPKAVDVRVRAWWKSVLPCLVVSAFAPRLDPDGCTFGTIQRAVSCRVEYLARAGNLAAGQDTAQTVIARLMQWLVSEQVTAGKRLSLLLDDGDGLVADVAGDTDYREEGSAFWVNGTCEFVVKLRSAQT